MSSEAIKTIKEIAGNVKRSQHVLPVPESQLDPSHLATIDIRDLRKAIRASQVSFPSQVPTFTKHDRPELERKLAQLYYVLGWDSGHIGARYGLNSDRVCEILNVWRRRAVQAGYIQPIPPAAVMSPQPIARTVPSDDSL
jgi:hypothetical protein